MLLYNVTIKVNSSIAEEWLSWLTCEHIPEMLGTGCFIKASVLRLLETDDADGPTYAIQYITENESLYNVYIDTFSEDMRQKSFKQWGDNFIAFLSIMEFVN